MQQEMAIPTYYQIPTNTTYCDTLVCFDSSGKERDAETGLSYFGARYYDSDLLSGWLSVDPMTDKYPSLSPYNYCAGNPMKFVDPDGSELFLPGGNLYTPNMKVDHSKHSLDDIEVINALNKICASEEGLNMLQLICESQNVATIDVSNDETGFIAQGASNAFFNDDKNLPGTGDVSVSIYWNYSKPENVQTIQGLEANATMNLLDEICHAYDGFTGYLTNADFDIDCNKNEFQAVYRTNGVRHQLGNTNYRTHYYMNDGHGCGPITAKMDKFYRPIWYPKAKSDFISIPMVY